MEPCRRIGFQASWCSRSRSYSRASVVDPNAYIVPGQTFGRTLTPAQLRTSLHFCSRAAGKEPLGVA